MSKQDDWDADNIPTEPLADLPLATEQAEATKAGTTTTGTFTLTFNGQTTTPTIPDIHQATDVTLKRGSGG